MIAKFHHHIHHRHILDHLLVLFAYMAHRPSLPILSNVQFCLDRDVFTHANKVNYGEHYLYTEEISFFPANKSLRKNYLLKTIICKAR